LTTTHVVAEAGGLALILYGEVGELVTHFWTGQYPFGLFL
jgi:hypothetical protein